MIERKRLTTNEKYPHGAEGVSENKLTGRYCRGVFEATACVEKLAEYETAEEEGKLLIFPVALGDKVYVIDKYVNSGEWNLSNYEHIVTDILLNRNRGPLFRTTNRGGTEKFENFGKTVFLTREEAEKALEEIKKNE